MSGGLSLTERLEQMVSKKVREIKLNLYHVTKIIVQIIIKNWENYHFCEIEGNPNNPLTVNYTAI